MTDSRDVTRGRGLNKPILLRSRHDSVVMKQGANAQLRHQVSRRGDGMPDKAQKFPKKDKEVALVKINRVSKFRESFVHNRQQKN